MLQSQNFRRFHTLPPPLCLPHSLDTRIFLGGFFFLKKNLEKKKKRDNPLDIITDYGWDWMEVRTDRRHVFA